MEVKIYGRPNCQWCDAAKALVDRFNIPYVYIDLIDMTPERRATVLSESGMRTVPIVKVDDIYIGGFDALDGYLRGKGLKNNES